MHDSTVANWSVLLYCFEPISFHYSTLLLSESLFAALFLAFVWLIIRFLQEPSRTLVLPAIALSAATYTRPVTLYFIIWLVPFSLLFPRRLALRKRLVKTAAFVAVFVISVAPWIVRNAAVADYHGFALGRGNRSPGHAAVPFAGCSRRRPTVRYAMVYSSRQVPKSMN